MSNGIRLLPEDLRSISSGTFTGTYQTLGTPLDHEIRLLKFVNNSNVDVTVSWNGTDDHDFLPASSAVIYDVTANKSAISGVGQLNIAAQTQFYVSGSAGGGNAGSVYLIALYAA